MTETLPEPEFCPLGVDGILIRFARTLSEAANRRAIGFRDLVSTRALPGVTGAASSLTSVRVAFDPAITDRATLRTRLQDLLTDATAEDISPKRRWDIPVAFGTENAPQLAEAAALAGLTPDQAIAEITAYTVRVIAIGFAPGQPYLGMLPPHWDIARQSELTPRMPNGALVAAVRQLIIFAADAPTGWRHIGQTAFKVYDPDREEAFAFTPGDAVRFNAVSDSALADLRANTDTNGGATCTVLR
ncbi:5-oxoprolinase subunit B family protein [Loktanella agnita]|uniref:5-oxoprolinase subunit B family protein n=1 Tax=Loktanella agnita TaxID=287097 RepID=UPI0039863B47